MKLVCAGDNVIDFYPEINRYFPGGSTVNVAVQARRLGIESAYIGLFGNDRIGQYLKEVLIKEGVDISHTSVKEGKNAYSIVKEKEKGVSQIIKVNKGVFTEFFLTESDLNFIKDYDYFHTTSYSYTERYLSTIKKMGLIVSYDYSFRTEDQYLKKTAPWIDIAFFSGKRIKKDYREFMVYVNELGPEVVIVTLADEGVLSLKDGEFNYQPAIKLNPVDTQGSGDAFIASFLYNHYKNTPLPVTLQKANEKAAYCCSYYGGIGSGQVIDSYIKEKYNLSTLKIKGGCFNEY